MDDHFSCFFANDLLAGKEFSSLRRLRILPVLQKQELPLEMFYLNPFILSVSFFKKELNVLHSAKIKSVLEGRNNFEP